MSVVKEMKMGQLVDGNPYVGRGIVIGKSADGKSACFAYFIMGRSVNSRNRIFVEEGKDVTYNKDFCTATYEWVNWRSDLTYITKKDARNFFSVFQWKRKSLSHSRAIK